MGLAQSDCSVDMDPETFELLNRFPEGLDRRNEFPNMGMAGLCIFDWEDPEKAHVQQLIAEGGLTPAQQRGLGCFMGMMVGDAMGAPMEFSAVRYGATEFPNDGSLPKELWTRGHYNTFSLKPGQWTDDASMGLCLADSLLVKEGHFHPQDLRLRFVNWWALGLNNAFGFDNERRSKGSVGLGGNISQSMSEFMRDRTPYTLAGDRNTCGNGSVMRNAAVPLAYASDMAQGCQVARQQSKTTHQGDEAAECCAIMTWLAIQAMNEPNVGMKELLGRLPQFESPFYSIQCLVNSRKEERCEANKHLDLKDRNWNWKSPEFRYSPTRAERQPGYVGSYCMDALSMSLHCVWTTNSFTEAVLKIINMRGDSDSTASVCAQIAGSIYGIDQIPVSWRQAVQRWDAGGMCMLKAWRLMKLLK